MKTRISLSLIAASTLLASAAFADTAAISAHADPKIAVGAQLELLPVGTFHVGTSQQSQDQSAEVAYGVSGSIDYAVHPNLSIGFAPRLALNVIPTDVTDGDAAQQLDLRARVKAHAKVASGVEAYGYLAPGYSMLFNNDDTASGLAIAFGAGATYDLSPTTYLSGEIGYQAGFQSESILGQTVDIHARYLHLGFGAGARF